MSNNDNESYWDKIILAFERDKDKQLKSEDELQVWLLMIVLVLIATCGCLTLFYCSMSQEKSAAQKKRDQRENRGKMLTKCLEPRKWDADPSTFSDTESLSVSGSETSSLDDYQQQQQQNSPSFNTHDNRDTQNNNTKNKGFDQCMICEKPFDEQCTILQSNNPMCGHIFHKNCMETWLNYEHLCPICLNVFALQDPALKQKPRRCHPAATSNKSFKSAAGSSYGSRRSSSASKSSASRSYASQSLSLPTHQQNVAPAPPMPSIVELPDDAFTIEV